MTDRSGWYRVKGKTFKNSKGAEKKQKATTTVASFYNTYSGGRVCPKCNNWNKEKDCSCHV